MSTTVDSQVDQPAVSRASVILPDLAICESCRRELFDEESRRFRYPFVSCAACGPRFSILRQLPFERANTTMARFDPCDRCRAEYEGEGRQAGNQTIACPDCGPHVAALERSGETLATGEGAFRAAVDALRRGAILCVKGFGGYQFVVDARNDQAVQLLHPARERPPVLMFPDLAAIEACCRVSEVERTALVSRAGPVVRLRRLVDVLDSSRFRTLCNSGMPFLGAALPATAMQLLLLHELSCPVMITDTADAGDAVCSDDDEARRRLSRTANLFLSHDLGIARALGDAVVREAAGQLQTLRGGRGFAPLQLRLPSARPGPDLLAVGGHRETTVAVSNAEAVLLSQHIGDLEALPVFDCYRHTIEQLCQLADAEPRRAVRDAHPDYLSSRYAQASELPVTQCQHHVAHVLSCIAEHGVQTPVLGVAWDGSGMGTDERLWGGEFVRVDDESVERVAHFRPFRLPGGEAALREPRRAALGLLYEFLGHKMFGVDWLNPMKACTRREMQLLSTMLHRGFNSPVTTSVGLLFDAVASLAGVRQLATHAGQGLLDLEGAVEGSETHALYTFEVREGDSRPWIVDWEPLIRDIVRDVNRKVAPGKISAKFHNTLAEIVVNLCRRCGERNVVLSGGCFENRCLTEQTLARLEREGFRAYIPRQVPPGDGGIALGQILWGRRQ